MTTDQNYVGRFNFTHNRNEQIDQLCQALSENNIIDIDLLLGSDQISLWDIYKTRDQWHYSGIKTLYESRNINKNTILHILERNYLDTYSLTFVLVNLMSSHFGWKIMIERASVILDYLVKHEPLRLVNFVDSNYPELKINDHNSLFHFAFSEWNLEDNNNLHMIDWFTKLANIGCNLLAKNNRNETILQLVTLNVQSIDIMQICLNAGCSPHEIENDDYRNKKKNNLLQRILKKFRPFDIKNINGQNEYITRRQNMIVATNIDQDQDQIPAVPNEIIDSDIIFAYETCSLLKNRINPDYTNTEGESIYNFLIRYGWLTEKVTSIRDIRNLFVSTSAHANVLSLIAPYCLNQ